jgi:hypothetical protein
MGLMTSTVKLKAAEALLPLLSVFHEVDGALLKAVRQTITEESISVISLDFGSKALIIEAEEDDTVTISIKDGLPQGDEINNQQQWIDLIGKPMGWGWVTVNQQGYLDGVLLSFDGVIPQLLITVVASSLKTKRVC